MYQSQVLQHMADLKMPAIPTPFENAGSLQAIKNSMGQGLLQQQEIQANSVTAQEKQSADQEQAQWKTILSDPSAIDPATGQPTIAALRKIAQTGPAGTDHAGKLAEIFGMDPKSVAYVKNLQNESDTRTSNSKTMADTLAETITNNKAMRDQAAANALATQNKPEKLAPGEALVSPQGAPIYTNAPKETPVSNDFELWLKQNPQGTAQQYQDMQAQRQISVAKAGKDDAASRYASTPLANVDPKLAPGVNTEFQKYNASYSEAVQSAKNMSDSIELARQGNKLAYAYAPVEGVLTINVGNQVKRVNMQEIEAYGGAGSALDRVKSWLGKQATGESIPDNILNDMASLHQQLSQNARGAFKQKVDGLNYGSGSTYNIDDPRLTGAGTGAAGGGMVSVQIPGHPPGKIPASALPQFLKENPGARQTQ